MPRAFCPECGSEVPVDADGVCHVGHRVDLAGTSAGPDGSLDAAFPPPPEEPEEPQPWVASVDESSLGGYTPPPGGADAGNVPPPDAPMTAPPAASATADEPAWTPADDDPRSFDIGGGDDLASAAAAAVESLSADEDDRPEAGPDAVEARGEQAPRSAEDELAIDEAGWPHTLPAEGPAPGWTPLTNDPVAPPPEPPPAPADPPAPAGGGSDDLDAGDFDFDFDDLAAAVSEIGMDDPAPAPTSGAAPAPVEPAEARQDLGHTDDGGWPHDDLGHRDDLDGSERGAVPHEDATAPQPSDAGGDGGTVDLSNFTAKGKQVKGDDGGRGGLFRRR